jgi:5-methyltetrahydropteroyltriglutamate--homocysteine methyltransferase
MLPRLIKRPFRYATFAYKYLDLVKQFTHKPVKQAVIAASTLSLVYAPHILKTPPIDDYSHEQFLKDLIHEAEKDIRLCLGRFQLINFLNKEYFILDHGAHVVQLDFTGARLSIKMDPTGKLLKEFVDINNRVLDRFTEAEQKKIGVHVCPGSDCDSHVSKYKSRLTQS